MESGEKTSDIQARIGHPPAEEGALKVSERRKGDNDWALTH